MALVPDGKERAAVITENRDKKRTLQVRFLDVQSMSLKEPITVVLPKVGGEQLMFDDAFFVDHRLLICATSTQKSTKSIQSWGLFVDSQTGDLSEPALLLDQADNRQQVGYALAPNGKMILVYPKIVLPTAGMTKSFIRVLDENLQAVWERKLDLPITPDLSSKNTFRIDDRGFLYILLGSTHVLKDRSDAAPLRSDGLSLILYDPDQNSVKEFSIDPGENHITGGELVLLPNGDVAVAGFYTTQRYLSVAGSFYFRVNTESKTASVNNIAPFPTDLLAQFKRSNQEEKNAWLDQFYFDYLLADDAGNVVLSAENYEFETRFQTDITTGRQRITNHYYFNDVLVLKLDTVGNLLFGSRIPKFQSTIDDSGVNSSYTLAASSDSIAVIFMDSPENASRLSKDPSASLKAFSGARNSVITLCSLSSSGDQSRRNPAQLNVETRPIIPSQSVYAGDVVLLLSKSRRNFRLAKVEW
ncbi:MAG: hypothetical protein RL226_143 [Bacteroidota bacterium]